MNKGGVEMVKTDEWSNFTVQLSSGVFYPITARDSWEEFLVKYQLNRQEVKNFRRNLKSPSTDPEFGEGPRYTGETLEEWDEEQGMGL